MRVVFDTSVWMAALLSRNGASFALLSQIGAGRVQYGVSTSLYLEYESKMLMPATLARTRLSRTQVEAVLAAIGHFANPVPIFFRLRPNLRDEGDNFVFECAAHFGAEYIVTHNVRDFLNPEVTGYNVRPVTPGDFLQRLRSDER